MSQSVTRDVGVFIMSMQVMKEEEMPLDDERVEVKTIIQHLPFIHIGESEAEAVGSGEEILREHYPPEEGWSGHSVNAVPVILRVNIVGDLVGNRLGLDVRIDVKAKEEHLEEGGTQ